MIKSCDYIGRDVEQLHCDRHLTCTRCLAAERSRLQSQVDQLEQADRLAGRALEGKKQALIDAEVERDRYKAAAEERRNMLEDVVNELDLSDGMIEQHGPMGTAPATLVRLVLARKDQEIAMLKAGMKPLAEAVQS